jgi:hypothetical protein
MQINNEALAKILSGSDEDLKKIISAAAGEGGVAIPNISTEDLVKLRAALGSLGSTPLAMNEILKSAEAKKKNR